MPEKIPIFRNVSANAKEFIRLALPDIIAFK